MYAALTHVFDCVGDPAIDVNFKLDPRTLLARGKANLERAQSEANLEHVAPPWTFAAERLSILDDECRRRIVQLAEWPEAAFLAPLQADCSLRRGSPEDIPFRVPEGQAALRESEALSQMRHELVPRRMSDTEFWMCFFHHVDIIRSALLPPPTAAEEIVAADAEWESFLASPLRAQRGL